MHKRIWKPIRGLIPICCIKQDILLIRFGWYAPWVLIRVPVGSCIWIVSVNRPWQKAGDIAAVKGLHLKDKTSKTSRFVENERVFNCQSVTLQYLFDSPRLKKIVGMENLTLNVSTSDLFYISSVKRERGTAYPFSRLPGCPDRCLYRNDER